MKTLAQHSAHKRGSVNTPSCRPHALLPFPAACVSPYYNFKLLSMAGVMPRELLIGGDFDVFLKEGPQGLSLAAFCGWLV